MAFVPPDGRHKGARLMRSYIRMDPQMVEKKLAQGYSLAQIGAYAMLMNQAEQQPERGWFKSMGVLREAMDCMAEEFGAKAKVSQHLPFLFEQRDVVKIEGRYYVEGWNEWQEGDHTPQARMELVRGRKGRPGDPGSSGAKRQRAYRARLNGADAAPAGASQESVTSDVTNAGISDASPDLANCDERHDARDLDRQKAVVGSNNKQSPLPPAGDVTRPGVPDSGLERGVPARVQRLQEVCLDVLKRDVLGDEWVLVRGWVGAKRAGELIPIEELEAAMRHYLSQPTKSGRMPYGLGFIDKQMLALAREPFRLPGTTPGGAYRAPRHVIPPEDAAGYEAAMQRGIVV